jgi:site-specific DNA-methyltransferase (adenine-specific)
VTDPYYEDDHCTIYHGDALDVLPSLTDAHFDAVVLDPPYSMQPNAVRGRDDGAAGASGAPVMLLSESICHSRRLLRPGGIAPLICDWRRLPDVSYIATLHGFRIATCVAWTRGRAGTGGLFRGAWDPILVLSSGSPLSVDRAAVRNVIELDYPTKRVHPYEKPLGLWAHTLQRIPVGAVVDPFMGAGASLVDSLRLGHRYIGIEIEERYCEIAAKRLAQEVLPL